MTSLTVNCYSGSTYAERPVSFTWQGTGYRVEQLISAWREPGRRLFLVSTEDNKSFRLCYNEKDREWSLTELNGG